MTRNTPPKTAREMAAVVELAEARTKRTLAATQTRLLPEETSPLQAEELARRVAVQLQSLPEDDRHLLRRNLLVSVHDLEGLIDALQAQMGDLAQELRKVSSHTAAATAYGRTAQAPAKTRR